jgi:hypothetical protein
VCVTGSAGFLGTFVVRGLAERKAKEFLDPKCQNGQFAVQ